MKSKSSIWLCLLLAVCPVIPVGGQESKPEISRTADEEELFSLINGLYWAYEQPWSAESREMEDAKQRIQFLREHDPAKEYVPLFLSFEQRHRGTHVGLMALRHLINEAARGGVVDNPRAVGRREALKRLAFYGDQPELPEVLRYLDCAQFEPQTEPCLRSLANDERALAVNRQFARLMLAQWMLEYRDAVGYDGDRVARLNAGAEPEYPFELEHISSHLALLPSSEQFAAWEKEAPEILRDIANSPDEFRQPAVTGDLPHYYIIHVDEEKTKTMRTLAEIAAGRLFRETQLWETKSAPDLDLTLVSGEKWSLASQRGKVVIIQFSFKGCGPCEVMYPTLHDLQQKYGDRISILSIMADENKSDAEQAVASGKLTWNVYWDESHRGPIVTQWGIQSFPTVYIIDRSGHIAVAAIAPPPDKLKSKVGELLN